MPKGSKLEQVKTKLEREYPGDAHAVWGTLNRSGLARGNKATKKGAQPAPKRKR